MALLQRLRSRFAPLPARVALAGFVVLALPPLLVTPWIPFVDLIAFVGLNNFPPSQSAGPLHFAVFQFTYIIHHAIIRFLSDLGVPRGVQVLLLYWLQAGIFFGIIQFLLRRLLPSPGACALAIATGVLAFWDGQFLWGGPLAFSLAAASLALASTATFREVNDSAPPQGLLVGGLCVLAMLCHPFAFPFALVVLALRALFLRSARWPSLGLALGLAVFASVIKRDSVDSPDSSFGVFFGFPGTTVFARVAHLFTADRALATVLFENVPTGLELYFFLMGVVHLLGFLAAPVVAIVARESRGLRLIAVHTTLVAGMYFCSRDNTVISEWPQRVLSFHSPLLFVAGIVLPSSLWDRWTRSLHTPSPAPRPRTWIAPLVALAFILWVQVPVLRLGRDIERNYQRLRTALTKSDFSNAFVVTAGVERIRPFYLRAVPFLLFSEPEVVRRNLVFFTEWHLQLRHPTRLTERWFDIGRPRFQGTFDCQGGTLSLHISQPDANTAPVTLGNNSNIPNTPVRLAEIESQVAAELLGLGATRDAIIHFQTAASLSPRSSMAQNNLAVALLRANRPADALVHAEAALRLDPRSAPVLANLGVIHAALDAPAKAVPFFQNAIALNDRVAQWHVDFGVTCERLGRPADARICYEVALRLEPDHPVARQALERLPRP